MATILIVDDRASNRQLLTTLLGYAGHRLLEAGGGDEALVIARSERPDLIITDIVMPVMDGYEFARLVRAEPVLSRTQVVFYTASYVVAEARQLAEACGVAHIISKPAEAEEILRTVAEALGEAPAVAPTPPPGEAFHQGHMRVLTDKLAEKVEELEAENAERRRAEDALQASEAELRALFAAMTDVILVLSAEGRYLKIAPTSPRYLYAPAPELIGRTLHEVFPAAQADIFLAHIRRALAGERPAPVEYSLSLDGETFWFEAAVSPMDQDSVFWVARDITPRKRAEQALQHEKERAQQYLDIAGVVFLVLAADQTVLLINKKGCEILEYSESEIVGRQWADNFLPSWDRERMKGAFNQLIAGDIQPHEYFENSVLAKSGQEKLIAWHNSLVTDEAGKIVGVVSSGEDITNRRQAEQALQRSEERYRLMFDHNPLPMFLYDAHSLRFMEVNDAAVGHYGYSRDEFLRMTVPDLHPLEEQTRLGQTLTATSQPPERSAVWQHRLKNGILIDVEIISHEIVFAGRAARLVLANDITQRRRAEDEVLRQLDRLAGLRAVDQAISGSLDLRVTLPIVLDQVTIQLQADAADVFLLRPHSTLLEYAAGRGLRTTGAMDARLRLGQEYAGRVALERRIVTIPDLAQPPAGSPRVAAFEAEGYRCYCGVPLISKGAVIGVLEVFRRTPFDPDPGWLDFLDALAGQAAIAIENARLFDDLQHSNQGLSLAYDATIEGWSRALDLRDHETEGHTRRVTELTLRLAPRLGIAPQELVHVRRGALLHDIGKMGVPDRILLKPGALSDDEWVIMRQHPVYAFEMLSPIQYLRPALDIPYCHHEKWDGTGYPRQLRGLGIPLAARVFAVADVWDALTSDRPYRGRWPAARVREYVRAQSGQHFDPDVLEVFEQVIEETTT